MQLNVNRCLLIITPQLLYAGDDKKQYSILLGRTKDEMIIMMIVLLPFFLVEDSLVTF